MLKYVLYVVTLTVCIFIAFQFYTRFKDGPPGPKGYPLFGVIFEVDSKTLYKKLDEWTKQYGDTFQFRMLGKKFYASIQWKFCGIPFCNNHVLQLAPVDRQLLLENTYLKTTRT